MNHGGQRIKFAVRETALTNDGGHFLFLRELSAARKSIVLQALMSTSRWMLEISEKEFQTTGLKIFVEFFGFFFFMKLVSRLSLPLLSTECLTPCKLVSLSGTPQSILYEPMRTLGFWFKWRLLFVMVLLRTMHAPSSWPLWPIAI